MVTAIPHFISTVVMAGLILVFLEPKGLVGQQMHLFGFQAKVNIIGIANYFKYIYAVSDMWQAHGLQQHNLFGKHCQELIQSYTKRLK